MRRASCSSSGADGRACTAGKLRSTYAWVLLGAMVVQLVLIYAAFFCLGAEWIHVSESAANIFMITGFTHTVGLVVVIVHHLFPKRVGDVIRLIEVELRHDRSLDPRS